MSYKELAKKLNYPISRIEIKSHSLGLKKVKTKAWTEEEIQFLKDNYKTMSYKELSEKLNRSEGSIKGKLKHLGFKRELLKKWTEEEIQFLKDNYANMSYKELAKKLNLPVSVVKTKRYSLKLPVLDKHFIQGKRWTEEEIQFLKDNYKTMSRKELAKKLNRSTGSIDAKKRKLTEN